MENIIITFNEPYFKVLEELSEYNTDTSAGHPIKRMMILSDTPLKRGELRIKSLNITKMYCNYSKDKHGNEITFIIPSWLDIEEGHITTDSFGCPVKPVQNTYDFLSGLGNSERQYFRLLHVGHTPQEARDVLPNATKTEIIVTGFASDWKHFFDLRVLGTTGAPHPDMKALAEPLMQEFKDKGLL